LKRVTSLKQLKKKKKHGEYCTAKRIKITTSHRGELKCMIDIQRRKTKRKIDPTFKIIVVVRSRNMMFT
jgi:hypothetical protein